MPAEPMPEPPNQKFPSAQHTPSVEVLRHRPMPWLKPVGLAAAGALVVVVAGGLISRGLASQRLKSWTEAAAIPTVSVIRPDANLGAQTLVLPGQVQAFYSATVRARVDGYLKRWYQDIGARVSAGQALADIDTPELDQQLAQAKADLASAQSNQQVAQSTAARW